MSTGRIHTYEAPRSKPANPTHHRFQHLVEHRKYDQILSRYLGFMEVGKLAEAVREREHLSVALQTLEHTVRAETSKGQRR